MLVDKVRQHLRAPDGLAMQDSAGIRAELHTLWSRGLCDARSMIINADNVADYFDTAYDQYDYRMGGTVVKTAMTRCLSILGMADGNAMSVGMVSPLTCIFFSTDTTAMRCV